MIAEHTFYKTGGSWYIDLPDYPGPKGDLQMVAGADTTLDIMAGNRDSVHLLVSEDPEPAFDELERIDKNDVGSGAYYLMKSYKGKAFNKEMWLCDVTKYVFGDFPEKIYIKKMD